MRQTAQIMGMPITIDIPDCDDSGLFEMVFDVFSDADQQFSPYKSDSELSLYNAGRIPPKKLTKRMKLAIEGCREYQTKTDGLFNAWYGNQFDPSGFVKGWAIAQAGDLLQSHGAKTFCIFAGGDILGRGDKTWRVGIQDPLDRQKIIAVVGLKNMSVATSGNYERGEHIINPKTRKAADELASLTVVGPDIIEADVLATAGFVAGRGALGLLNRFNREGLIVDKSGHLIATAGWSELLV